MQDRIGRRAFLVGAGAVAVLAACSGDDNEPASSGSTTTAGEDEAPQKRVLLLGEEYLLADAMALGITPIASTATVADRGFIGVDQHDTSGIQVLDATDQDLEPLVALDTDVVVAAQYVADAIGTEALEPFGEVTVVPDGLTPVEVLDLLAGLFDRQA